MNVFWSMFLNRKISQGCNQDEGNVIHERDITACSHSSQQPAKGRSATIPVRQYLAVTVHSILITNPRCRTRTALYENTSPQVQAVDVIVPPNTSRRVYAACASYRDKPLFPIHKRRA